MHYYKRNIGDYAKKAGRLSMLQHGSYTLLIDACYDREQFPTMDEAIEWTWASSTAEIEAVQFVLRKFFTLEGGIYVQARIQEEIAEYHAKSETNQRIAIERETKRREGFTKRAQGVNEPPPNQEPITNNHKPVKNKDKSPPAPDSLFPDVDPQIVADFKALRTKHKAPITRTAMQGIVREAEKAGLTLEGALRICCERGWRGFKAEWITQHAVRAGSGQGTSTVYDQTMAAAERAKARIFGSTAQQGEKHDAG